MENVETEETVTLEAEEIIDLTPAILCRKKNGLSYFYFHCKDSLVLLRNTSHLASILWLVIEIINSVVFAVDLHGAGANHPQRLGHGNEQSCCLKTISGHIDD
jgi:hypothetical protein